MAYAIFRTAKYKNTDKAKGVMAHHLREVPGAAPNANPTRSHLNITLGALTRSAMTKAVNERLATCTRKPRPDANRIVELMCTASPEFFSDKSHDQKKAYLLDCVEFAKHKFGAANVVGAYLHFDEMSPNVHIMCVPLETSMRTTKKMAREITALNAGHYFGGKEKMIVWQDEFAAFVQSRGHDLKRGEPKAETGRGHTPVSEYWKQKKRDIDGAQLAVAELLATASSEAKNAAVLRRDAVQRQAAAKVREEDAQTLLVSLDAQRSALLPAAQLSELAQRPELAGMLDFLANDSTARDLLSVLKSDTHMGALLRQNVSALASTGLEQANWTPKQQPAKPMDNPTSDLDFSL